MISPLLIILAGAVNAVAVADSPTYTSGMLSQQSAIISRVDGPLAIRPKAQQSATGAKQPATPKPVYSPFDAAVLAPADVTAYIHVDHAADLRRQLANRPITQWVESLAAGGESSKAWTRLARSANLTDIELFDFVLGERFTLLARVESAASKRSDTSDRGGDAQPGAAVEADNHASATEWTLVTGVDQAKAAKILRQLKLHVLEPRAGFAIAELPEEDVLIAR